MLFSITLGVQLFLILEDIGLQPIFLAHFCSMRGPKFFSMKISQDVRGFSVEKGIGIELSVEEGMRQKAKEFKS